MRGPLAGCQGEIYPLPIRRQHFQLSVDTRVVQPFQLRIDIEFDAILVPSRKQTGSFDDAVVEICSQPRLLGLLTPCSVTSGGQSLSRYAGADYYLVDSRAIETFD